MGEERIELEKLRIVLFQSLAVLFSAYIVSFFKNAEYTPQSIAILYLLHFVVFYGSIISVVGKTTIGIMEPILL